MRWAGPGSPAGALAWLAGELDRAGLPPLAEGEIVTTGTLTGLTPVAAGGVTAPTMCGTAVAAPGSAVGVM